MPKKTAKSKSPLKTQELPSNKQGIKIRKLKLKNFKAFDNFEIEFPEPEIEGDPDIMVIGSENGVGKTSILEAISLLFFFSEIMDILYPIHHSRISGNFNNYFIRSGFKQSNIEAFLSVNRYYKDADLKLNLNTNGKTKFDEKANTSFINNLSQSYHHKNFFSLLYGLTKVEIDKFYKILLGRSHYPLILPGIAYFHSYRKVKEGSISPNDLFKKNSNIFVNFKEKIVKSYFPKMGTEDKPQEQEEQKKLFNNLLREFAEVQYKTPVETSDGTIDIPVYPIDGRPPFNFDGLSSGQKEIVSMIYLIWQYARNNSIILIDEPELHLNSGWHRLFIHRLCKLMPDNQYIISTHSEDVFGSVDRDRRILLVPDKVNK